jgi:taurine--2-oxoglutarate transaminase
MCKENNILLIMDEVICGFHRTGKAMGYMHYDVNPDLICLAKGISGGMVPFGALWTSKTIADYYDDNILSCGLTNYAHPLGMAALKGVLEIVNDQNFHTNRTQSEDVLKAELEKIKTLKNVKEIRSIGLLAAIDLHKTIEWKKFFENGLYLVSQTNRIILAPPLITSKNILETGMSRVYKTIKENE